MSQLKKTQTPWHGHGDARRVVKVRNNVDELRLSVLASELFKLCLKKVCSNAFFVHINGVNSRLIRRKCLERTKVTWALTDNIVPWVKKDTAQEIKRLLRTRSQNHLVRISLDALSS